MKYLSAIIIFCFIFVASLSFSATLYMGSEETYTNLQSAMTASGESDTIIIRDGTYTGATNIINASHLPHVGISDSWTIVKAENPGKVFFGDVDVDTRYYDTYQNGNRYTEFQGIIWLGGIVMNNDTDYVKFTQCGVGTNLVDTGNSASFSIFYSSYTLCEDCFSWGGRRYPFLAYNSDHVIFRRCVGRIDACDTSHDASAEPIGGVAIYWSSYCEVQNCIIVDSDTESFWTYQGLVGAFTEPNQGGSNNYFRGCIALNNTMPLHMVHSAYSASNRSNMVGWDIYTGSLLRGTSTVLDHCTIGSIDTAYGGYGAINNYEGSTSITNSILTGISTNYAVVGVTSNYNSFYNNNSNYSNTTPGDHDQTATNPLTNSLLYLPRIEDSSDLDGEASDSGDVGATVLKKIGTDGTLWGETGYATTTGNDLWPYPNEDTIKTQFAAYEYDDGGGGDPEITGARGFCTGTSEDGSAQTLTKYIWEYLGNEIPASIYGTTPTMSGMIIN